MTDPAPAFRPCTRERSVEEMIGKPQTNFSGDRVTWRDGARLRSAINGFGCS